MSKVKVQASEDGSVVRLTSNPKYGYIVVAMVTSIFEGGWMRESKRTALISGETEMLKNAGFYNGQELEGKIQVIESLTPFEGDPTPEKRIKIAGNTGIPCKLDGQPIYRKTEFTSDVDAKDILIAHNNKEEIQAAYQASQASAPAGDSEATL